MALISVNLRSGKEATGENGKETSTRVYVVKYDTFAQSNHYSSKTADDGTTAIPAINDEHPDNIAMQVNSISSDPVDNYYTTFIVTVSYAQRDGSIGEQLISPLDRPARFTWSGVSETVEAYEDKTTPTAKPYVTTAGVPYNDTVQLPISLAQVNITKNVAAKSVSDIFSYMNTTNSLAKVIDGYSIPADKALCESIAWGEEQIENNITYFVQTITIKIKEAGYDRVVPQRGYYAKDGNEIKPILDKNKQPIQEPWPLDATGAAKANIDDDPAEITYKDYKSVDWTSFDLT